MRGMKLRLITFDVTGTLLMTKLEEHYMDVAVKHGITVDPSKLGESFKRNFKRLANQHPIYGKHSGLGWENWWRVIVHNVFKDQDHRISDTQLNKVASSLIDHYGTASCWHKYPGTEQLLEYLRSKGVALGIISNFDERLEGVLQSTNLRPYFSFVLSSYVVGTEKPHPSIFEEALKAYKRQHGGDISPKQALHVGDTVKNDYLGAKECNWNALLVNSHEKDLVEKKRIPAEHVLDNLSDLKEHFESVVFGDVDSKSTKLHR